MGCNEEVDFFCYANEYPYHEVYLDAFYIDRNISTVCWKTSVLCLNVTLIPKCMEITRLCVYAGTGPTPFVSGAVNGSALKPNGRKPPGGPTEGDTPGETTL